MLLHIGEPGVPYFIKRDTEAHPESQGPARRAHVQDVFRASADVLNRAVFFTRARTTSAARSQFATPAARRLRANFLSSTGLVHPPGRMGTRSRRIRRRRRRSRRFRSDVFAGACICQRRGAVFVSGSSDFRAKQSRLEVALLLVSSSLLEVHALEKQSSSCQVVTLGSTSI